MKNESKNISCKVCVVIVSFLAISNLSFASEGRTLPIPNGQKNIPKSKKNRKSKESWLKIEELNFIVQFMYANSDGKINWNGFNTYYNDYSRKFNDSSKKKALEEKFSKDEKLFEKVT
jgi:hypothetical protein